VLPALLVMAVLLSAIGYGLDQSVTAGTLNNVAFACLHLSVLLAGSWSAIVGCRRASLPVPHREEESSLRELVA
jgi:hypothetical protein